MRIFWICALNLFVSIHLAEMLNWPPWLRAQVDVVAGVLIAQFVLLWLRTPPR